MINALDSLNSGVIEHNMKALILCLMDVLNSNPIAVQEYCILCLHSIAETADRQVLAPYYAHIVPTLKRLLSQLLSASMDKLCGQIAELICLLGESSGRDIFYADALEMVSLLNEFHRRFERDREDSSSDVEIFVLKAWVRIARCMGPEFAPYLDSLVSRVMHFVEQDISASGVDAEEAEQRSDIVLVETDHGWQAVRTAAVEELVIASQMLLHLFEKLQHLMVRYVVTISDKMMPLLESPHEDVRSFSMVLMPELVLSTAKAYTNNRSVVNSFFDIILGPVIHAIQTESSLELIMTGLQSLKACIENIASDWATLGLNGKAEALHPSRCIKFLTSDQMEKLSECAKMILKDSLQRRAVMRAEARVSGGVEEEDAEDEVLFMSSSMELHFNISELIGVLLKTHGHEYMPCYNKLWHETIDTMAHPNCLKEDRQFAFFVVCDVVEFGLLDPEEAKQFFQGVVPFILECCQGKYDASCRQSCCYALGIAAERFPREMQPFFSPCLQALVACVGNGEDDDEQRGSCTDNAVAAIGVIIEAIECMGDASLLPQVPTMWTQWLAYLPMRHDLEEGRKVLLQIIRCLSRPNIVFSSALTLVDRAITVLIEAMDSSLVTAELNSSLKEYMRTNSLAAGRLRVMIETLPASLREKASVLTA